MREATIKITKCGTARKPECPFATFYTSYCSHDAAIEQGDIGRRKLIRQNKDGITPSCPMYPQSVEVEG